MDAFVDEKIDGSEALMNFTTRLAWHLRRRLTFSTSHTTFAYDDHVIYRASLTWCYLGAQMVILHADERGNGMYTCM
jgi:hypothetical protein